MKKRITKKGYRVLAILWTLAAASIAVAFVRRLAEFNLMLLMLLALSALVAANFWKTYHKVPGEPEQDLFDAPPRFADDPELFVDEPPAPCHLKKDSEENTHE